MRAIIHAIVAGFAAVLLAQAPPAIAATLERETRIEEGYLATPDGQQLYYQKVGTAPRIVIQPGRLFAFEDFKWLGRHFTLISYDMRNRGRSGFVADDSAIGFEQDVADVETVRRHFGAERVSLLGYSYLGKIAILYALEHPDRVDRIVQFGPVPLNSGTEYRPEYVFTADPVDPAARTRLRALRNEQSYHLTHPREYCEQEWKVVQRLTLVGDASKVDRAGASACEMPNEWPILMVRHLRLHFEESGMKLVTLPERIRALATPVLTVHGTLDRNAPIGAGREWSYLLPQGRLLAIDGAAHRAFAESRETVMPAVLEFLNGAWPDAAVKMTEDPRQ